MKLTRSSRVVVASSPLAKLVLEGTGSLEDLDGSLGPLEEPLSLDELDELDEPEEHRRPLDEPL
jgi:hypothetical protein